MKFAMFLACALVLAAPVRAQAPDLLPGEEHLPRRAKPPAPGHLPAGIAACAERIGEPAVKDTDRLFDRIADELLLFELRAQPIRATELGVHDYDALLPATDSLGVAQAIAGLDEFHARLVRLDIAALGPKRQAAHARLTRLLADRLRELQTNRWWERDPETYLALVYDGFDSLLDHEFAPFEDRGWNVVARLTEVPRVLEHARANLGAPTKRDAEAAVVRSRDLVDYLSNRLPVKMNAAHDPVLREEFDHHLAAAAGRAADFHRWIEAELLPRARGDGSLDSTRAEARRLDRAILEALLRR